MNPRPVVKICCIASVEEAFMAMQAGGLGAHNVADAIRAVRPFGLDLCSGVHSEGRSGVRSEGRLDAVKLRAFMVAVVASPD